MKYIISMLSEKSTQNLYSVIEVVFILGKMWDISHRPQLGPQGVLSRVVNSAHVRVVIESSYF